VTTPDHTTRAHARFSPSKSDLWLKCTKGLDFIDELGIKDTTSDAAQEGTGAHMLLDKSLTERKPPATFKAEKFNGFEVSPDMLRAVEIAYAWVQTYLLDGYTLYNESRLQIECTGEFGTTDIGLMKGDHLIICDYKHGRGVGVHPEKNRQMRLYACGFLDTHKLWGKINRLTLGIAQPRVQEDVLLWEDSMDNLHYFRNRVAQIVDQIKRKEGLVFQATEKGCRFCPAKAQCKTYATWAAEQAGIEFEALVTGAGVKTPECNALTPVELLRVWKAAVEVKNWMKSVNDRIYQLLADGDTTMGLKLVEGRSTRKWANEGDAMDALHHLGFKADDFAPRNLLGLGKIEALFTNKALKQDFMRQHTIKPPGSPTIAEIDDPRPTYTSSSEFPDTPSDE